MAEKSEYLLPGRLADVLALLQVLAMDEQPHRSENGLASEFQGRLVPQILGQGSRKSIPNFSG